MNLGKATFGDRFVRNNKHVKIDRTGAYLNTCITIMHHLILKSIGPFLFTRDFHDSKILSGAQQRK